MAVTTDKLPPGVLYRRDWGNYLLEARREFGAAAHRNRGRYTGSKVHRLIVEYVVGLVDESIEDKPRTCGATFRATGQPVLFSCRPACGCTSGQHAGAPNPRMTAADVTCTKCGTGVKS